MEKTGLRKINITTGLNMDNHYGGKKACAVLAMHSILRFNN